MEEVRHEENISQIRSLQSLQARQEESSASVGKGSSMGLEFQFILSFSNPPMYSYFSSQVLHFLTQHLNLNMRDLVRLVLHLVLKLDNSQDLSGCSIFSSLSICFEVYQPCYTIDKRFFKENHRKSLV